MTMKGRRKMNETMKSKLTRLLNGADIYQIDVVYKGKTKDGMLYTLQRDTFVKEDATPGVFADSVYNSATETLLGLTDLMEKDGFYFADEDMVSIKKSEVTRVWAEIGDMYMDGAPVII